MSRSVSQVAFRWDGGTPTSVMQRVHARWLISVGALVASVGFLWQSAAGAGGHYVSVIFGPAVLISLAVACSTHR